MKKLRLDRLIISLYYDLLYGSTANFVFEVPVFLRKTGTSKGVQYLGKAKLKFGFQKENCTTTRFINDFLECMANENL